MDVHPHTVRQYRRGQRAALARDVRGQTDAGKKKAGKPTAERFHEFLA
jgi:hypothetical protein